MNKLHTLCLSAAVATLPIVDPIGMHRAKAADGVPALQIIAPNGQQSVIIGSMHIAWIGLRQPSARVFAGAKRFVIESSLVQGPQPPQPSLEEQLDPQVFAELTTTGKMTRAPWATWISDEQAGRLKRQMLCNAPQLAGQIDTVMQIMLGSKGAKGALAVAEFLCPPPGKLSRDQMLGDAAAQLHLPTEVLETQTAVQQQRDAVPENVYEALLWRDLNTDVRDSYNKNADALNTGDYDAVLKAMNEGANQEDEKVLYKIMVAERNASWMPVLEKYLTEGHSVILVGAGHLPGSQGIIALLKKDGYKSIPIELQAQ